KGKYLSFIDADDWVNSIYLEKLIEPMLTTTTTTDLICGGYYEVNSKFPKGLKLHDFKKEQFHENLPKQTYQSNLFNEVSGVLWAKLFKRAIFQENNIELHPELKFSEDLIAVLEYSTFIQNAYILPDSIYYYNRLNEDGLSGQLNIENYKDLKILISEIRKFKYELHFLDLNKIINKRKYDFMIKLLKDHIDSKKDFYK